MGMKARITLSEDGRDVEIMSLADVEVKSTEGHVGLTGKLLKAHPPLDDHCRGCGAPHGFESYAVHDELWTGAGLERKGCVMHLACFEALIGRRVEVADLKDVPLNAMLRHVLVTRAR